MSRACEFAMLALVLCIGCREKPKPVLAPPPAQPIQRLPVAMTVKQRSTTDVPGSDGKLRLTIDDITGGQVMASVTDSTDAAAAGPVSLQPGKLMKFQFSGQPFRLELDELSNAVTGEDYAQFTIRADAEDAITEQDKIERLMAIVETSQSIVFIRNGTEHTPKEAADHLRSKWNAAGQIATAQEFIDKVAAKSSLSGEPYQIRKADGSTVAAGEFLRDQLQQMK